MWESIGKNQVITKHKQKLKHTPTQFLASTHSMRDKFNVELWQVYAAYALGTPMPKSLQPVDEQGAMLPCLVITWLFVLL